MLVTGLHISNWTLAFMVSASDLHSPTPSSANIGTRPCLSGKVRKYPPSLAGSYFGGAGRDCLGGLGRLKGAAWVFVDGTGVDRRAAGLRKHCCPRAGDILSNIDPSAEGWRFVCRQLRSCLGQCHWQWRRANSATLFPGGVWPGLEEPALRGPNGMCAVVRVPNRALNSGKVALVCFPFEG